MPQKNSGAGAADTGPGLVQISTNMPGIGSLICEIDDKSRETWENKTKFTQQKLIPK